jgi:hypothetical protein
MSRVSDPGSFLQRKLSPQFDQDLRARLLLVLLAGDLASGMEPRPFAWTFPTKNAQRTTRVGVVRHLQAELDDMVNLMPVDQ